MNSRKIFSNFQIRSSSNFCISQDSWKAITADQVAGVADGVSHLQSSGAGQLIANN